MRPSDLKYRTHDLLYRAHRRVLMRSVDELYREILSQWDQPAFIDRFRPFWNPFPLARPSKFLDLNVWFREAIYRYFLWTGLPNRTPGQRILDLGAGTGYFLVVCRYMGHEVWGLDIDEEPLYREAFEFFRLPRIVHRIEPLCPLPPLPAQMDFITAFMTAFNVRDDGNPWGPDEWCYLLRDLKSRLAAGGRIIIGFNLNKKTGEFYSAELRRAIRHLAGFRAKFVRDYLILRAN